MLSSLNDKKHLPAKEFDAELGKLLEAQHERRAALAKQKEAPKAKAKSKK